MLWASSTYGQDSERIKGIVVDKFGTPIPYCNVSLKGTKIAAQTNQCGEFELAAGKEGFTIVFNCMSTQDFITFESRINPQDARYDETVVFQLEKHGKTVNKECNKKVDKRLRKLTV